MCHSLLRTAVPQPDRFFQHLGVPQARQSMVIWLVFIAMSCVMTACNTASVPNSTASPQVVATRWTALLIGKLVEAWS